MNKGMMLLLGAMLVLYPPCGAHAAQVTLEPSAIATLTPPEESDEATRYLVAIPLPPSLDGATIDFAKLYLGVRASVDDGALGLAPFMVDVYALDTQWSSGTTGWDSGWDSPGGDFSDDTHASFVSDADTTGLVALDLTHIVQAWADESRDSCGVILTGPPQSCCEITSVLESDPAPTVVVYYTPAEQ